MSVPQSATLIGLLLLTVWMVAHCVRHDPDRGPWLVILLAVPGIGALLYLLARFLPGVGRGGRPTARMGGRQRLARLRWEAETIGNAHQWTVLGEALLDADVNEQALAAFTSATSKDPRSLPALWGLARAYSRLRRYDASLDAAHRILEADPRYRFGEVSLLICRCLVEAGDTQQAIINLEEHVRAWRHPEAFFLLASELSQSGRIGEAIGHLRRLIGDVEQAPPAIARNDRGWLRKARRLLKSLRNNGTAP